MDLTNLIAYWPLDEFSDGTSLVTRRDLHQYQLHLTDGNNTPSTAPGKLYSNAATFNGVDDAMFRVSQALLQAGDIDFTIAGWWRLLSKPAPGDVVAVSKGDFSGVNAPAAWSVRYGSTLDRLYFHVPGVGANPGHDAIADDLGSPSTGVWYFFVGWHDSVNDFINFQVNNGTVNQTAHAGGANVENGEFDLGIQNNDGTSWMNGDLQGVSYWKRILTAQERSDLYRDDTWNAIKGSIPSGAKRRETRPALFRPGLAR